MGRIVQARLDEETSDLLRDLRRRTRLSESEIVRRGIKSLAAMPPSGGGVRVIGVGRFKFGRGDLATNKAYLKGFGKEK
jgi:hypothetical protein